MGVAQVATNLPAKFLNVRCTRLDPAPAVRGFCAGYELGRWRNDHFAAHLMTWLPDFALKHSEVEAIGAHNAVGRRSRRSVDLQVGEVPEAGRVGRDHVARDRSADLLDRTRRDLHSRRHPEARDRGWSPWCLSTRSRRETRTDQQLPERNRFDHGRRSCST